MIITPSIRCSGSGKLRSGTFRLPFLTKLPRLLSVLINSSFSFWWDVTNDWGLGLFQSSPSSPRQPPRPLLLPSLHSLQVDALVVDRITSDALVKWADRKRRAGKALKNIRFVGLDVDYQDEVEWQGEIRRYIDCVQIMSYQKESLVH